MSYPCLLQVAAKSANRTFTLIDRRVYEFADFSSMADNPVSSALTRERTGWLPTHPDLFTDLEQSGYFRS